MRLRVSVATTACGLILAAGSLRAQEPAVAASAPAVAASASVWIFSQPAVERLEYRGSLNMDAAGGGASSMFYPAPNLAGFAVGLLTHALLVGGQQEAQKKEMKAKADAVLVPYLPLIEGFGAGQFWSMALQQAKRIAPARIVDSAVAPGVGEQLVDMQPVFVMTQDQRALLLHNSLTVRQAGQAAGKARRIDVVVVSQPWGTPADGADPVPYWAADAGRRLRDESVRLLAWSIDLALDESIAARVPSDAAYRTVRFPEGSGERIERAQLLEESCGRRTMRTLRGTLMSVPSVGDCAASQPEPVASTGR